MDRLHAICGVFSALPILFIWYCRAHWPNVWLATIVPEFGWAMFVVLLPYVLACLLAFVIYIVTTGWFR